MIRGLLLAAALAQGSPFLTAASDVKDSYNSGKDEPMRSAFGKVMSEAFPAKDAKSFFDGLKKDFGELKELGKPRQKPGGFAIVPAKFERGMLDMKISLGARGKIDGLWFLPHTPDLPVPEKLSTELSLPFKGKWLVFWGGEKPEQNAHLAFENQKHAFDLLGVGPDGKTRAGKSEENEDYYAFGREILAPADGTVTDAIEGVRDNKPGSMNGFSALGNAVVLEHAPHEYSVLAHLKLGSVRVKAGDKVKRGQVLGLCGNSGNSSEPHLHFHVQNTPVIQDGTGLKVFFDGKSPVKGDVLSSR